MRDAAQPWESFWIGRVRHLVPTADLLVHELSFTCPCGPAAEGHWCPDGLAAFGVLHRALDGRVIT